MQANNIVNLWLVSSLYVLGVLLLLLGLSFIFFPNRLLSLAEKLNYWVHTDKYFEKLNRPRYQERFIYRHHQLFGALVIFFTSVCIYMMLLYADVAVILENVSLMADTDFGKWLLVSLYYILVAANILALIIGFVIFIRPSSLKKLEEKANHWVETESKLEVLNNSRDLPESIFPGNPRIFGLLVILGAAYIIWNTTAQIV